MTSASTADREIVTTRLIHASREWVWKAWTDPQHLAQWWGPKGFSNTFHTFELRPGCEWRFLMHGPDGTDYKNHSVFVEIVPHERLVLDHLSGPHFRMEATFVDRNGGTEVTFRGIFDTVKEFEQVKGFAIDGNRETMDRMADLVAILAGPTFILNRTYDAPRDLVWKAWTEADRLAQWWGPKGMDGRVAHLDLRPGGRFHYAFTMPDGHTLWGKFDYRDVVVPQRLVFVDSFSDEGGGTTRHPMSATWPLKILNVLTLDEVDGRTILTLKAVPIDATDEERRAFEGGFDSLQQGFKGTLDQLENHLSSEFK
jgi:uncharacterized protein YndB with AHSA1/START domain